MLGFHYIRLSIKNIIYKKVQKNFLRSQKRLNIEPIFIIGCNRSGTSVITKLLEQHPELHKTSKDPNKNYGRKTKNGHSLGFSESTHLLEMQALKTFSKKCFSKWAHPKFISNSYLNGYENKIDLSQLIKEIIAIDKKGRRPIIKDQLNTLRIKFLIDLFPKAKFIYIKRDLESYISSNIHKLNILKVEENINEISNICLHWMMANLICTFELKTYAKDRFIEFNFETVTSKKSLKSKLIDIFEFLEIQKIDLNLKFIDKNKKFKLEKYPSLSKIIINVYDTFNKMSLVDGMAYLDKQK